MPIIKVVIRLKPGLHARTALSIVKKMEGLNLDSAFITNAGISADCRSVLALLALYAGHGVEVTVEITGTDSEKAVEFVKDILSSEEDCI